MATSKKEQPGRSEGLLPAQEEGDGRFEVAEEVSLDQQSDAARQVGQLPEDAPATPEGTVADAVAETLPKEKGEKGGQQP